MIFAKFSGHFLYLAGSMASSARSPRVTEGACHGLDAAVPARVDSCLKKAKDTGEFKNIRCFRFLQLFAGPRDVLAEALVKECEKEGIKVSNSRSCCRTTLCTDFGKCDEGRV